MCLCNFDGLAPSYMALQPRKSYSFTLNCLWFFDEHLILKDSLLYSFIPSSPLL
jgi:hypothetical protein